MKDRKMKYMRIFCPLCGQGYKTFKETPTGEIYPICKCEMKVKVK